jgi:hypothetical protein
VGASITGRQRGSVACKGRTAVAKKKKKRSDFFSCPPYKEKKSFKSWSFILNPSRYIFCSIFVVVFYLFRGSAIIVF